VARRSNSFRFLALRAIHDLLAVRKESKGDERDQHGNL